MCSEGFEFPAVLKSVWRTDSVLPILSSNTPSGPTETGHDRYYREERRGANARLMTPTVVLVPVDEFGCGPLRIQLTKFKHVLQEHLGSRANVEIQYGGVPAAGPDVHVFRVVHSQEASVRAESRVHGPNVIEFVSRKYKHCQNDLLVYFEEGTDQLKLFGARSAVARIACQCCDETPSSRASWGFSLSVGTLPVAGIVSLVLVVVCALWLLLKINAMEKSQLDFSVAVSRELERLTAGSAEQGKKLYHLQDDIASLTACLAELQKETVLLGGAVGRLEADAAMLEAASLRLEANVSSLSKITFASLKSQQELRLHNVRALSSTVAMLRRTSASAQADVSNVRLELRRLGAAVSAFEGFLQRSSCNRRQLD